MILFLINLIVVFFERINHILIKLEEPTVENGLLTPSQKEQLTKIINKYLIELNALYDYIGNYNYIILRYCFIKINW